MSRRRPSAEAFLLTATAAALVGGVAAHAAGADAVRTAFWATGTAIGLVAACAWTVGDIRRGKLGVDLIAVLALVGTAVTGELFAGAVIALMLASGRALEARAGARAQRDLRLLLQRAPQTAHRRCGDELTSPPLDDVGPGDLLVVFPGEVVPCDGRVEASPAVLDESVLTGEPLPVERGLGELVRSGCVNAGGAFDLRCTTSTAESTYAGIVALVSQAEADSAPLVRLADRYAAGFLVVSLALAAGTWLVTGRLLNAVAVLVVATPCPLLLAAPVAIVSGLARAARRGVVVKGGAALEQLGRARALIFDKTGTVTAGRPQVSEVVAGPDQDGREALRLAACVEQISPHIFAGAVVRAATQRGLVLALPQGVRETHGSGVSGRVDGREIRVGQLEFAGGAAPPPEWATAVRKRATRSGSAIAGVSVDGELVAVLVVEDPIRAEAPNTVRRLRAVGLERLVLCTGDHDRTARKVGIALGLDEVLADQSPSDKLATVARLRQFGVTVMVGDGVNDAPALAAADVGVALGARGATASSETADVVLTVDRLDRLADVVAIARRSRRIALQSIGVGMGLSLVAMAVAAAGYLPPAWGAVLQEGIDVGVILNALRALRPDGRERAFDSATTSMASRFAGEHPRLRDGVEAVREAADLLDQPVLDQALHRVWEVYTFLVEQLLPHEQAEDRELYPLLNRASGSADHTASLSREHVELAALCGHLGTLLDDIAATPTQAELRELRALLYSLHAVLRLHFAQEEEGYFSLLPQREADPSESVEGSRP